MNPVENPMENPVEGQPGLRFGLGGAVAWHLGAGAAFLIMLYAWHDGIVLACSAVTFVVCMVLGLAGLLKAMGIGLAGGYDLSSPVADDEEKDAGAAC